ncbi:MAG TPA: glycosyltransferase family 39 protein [Gemmatimonadales bacterium]
MSAEAAARPQRLLPALLLTGIIVLAALLRFWRLGAWGLEGDEIFTLRDSLAPAFDNPRPLIYFLNYYLIRPLWPLDELGVRLLPALFGVLAVPALYLVARRLIGTRAALFAALLLALSPVHIYQSQYARYWSLVFLLSSVYPFAIYIGIRDRNVRALALGLATAALAVLAHPVSLFLAGGLAVWLLTQLRREHLRQLWGQPSVRWALWLLLIVAGVVAWRYVPMLHAWIAGHDAGTRLPDHLLFAPRGLGIKQIGLLAAYAEGLSLPVVLIGALGIYLLWKGRDRPLAQLLTCLFVVPAGVIVLLSLRTPVSLTYILSTAPVFYLGAGVFLDRLAEVDWELRPRWLLSAAVAAIVIAAGAPTLISQYRDGRRHDFRGAARWLDERLQPGDLVFSDQWRTMDHYLRGTEAQPLSGDPGVLREALRKLQDKGGGGALWVVAPYSARGGLRTNARIGIFKAWIYENCRLRNALGVARLDFRQNELQIYNCSVTPG